MSLNYSLVDAREKAIFERQRIFHFGKTYKLVRRTQDGRLVSSAVSDPRFVHEYSKERWTEARIGGLLVFIPRDPFEMSMLIPVLRWDELWTCQCEDMVVLPQIGFLVDSNGAFPSDCSEEEIRHLWTYGYKSHEARIKQLPTQDWPTGTYAFRRVRLIDKILSFD